MQLFVHPDVTEDLVSKRLAARMSRQKRLFTREIPTLFLVDQLALYRLVGSPEIMAAQMQHLIAMASRPRVTIQVVPVCWHSGMSGGFILTDRAGYAEAVHAGQVHGDDETVGALASRFDSIRSEAMRASESATLIREMLAHERLAKVNLLKRQRRRLR